MALNRIPCPECGAGLKSKTGFTVGQTVCCPKCETYFVVEEPADEDEEDEQPQKVKPAAKKTATTTGKKPVKAATASDDDEDDEEDDQPKKKKKKKKQDDDDDERSYKKSPLRFAVLGVLVVVMLVLGYFLYDKKMKERADNKETTSTESSNPTPQPLPGGPAGPGGPKRPTFVPGVPGGPKGPNVGPGGVPTGPGLPMGVEDPPIKLSDAEISKLLVGKWLVDESGDGGPKIKGTDQFKQDGTVDGEATIEIGDKSFKISVSGTWKVADGTIVETITKTSAPQLAPVGLVSKDRVISIDDKMLKYRDEMGRVRTHQRMKE